MVKNVAKSVFTLTTFKADGSLLASSHGVFVGNEGEAVSDLKPFLGAAKAVVVDAKGNKMDVTRIMGINDIYDVARFRVDGKTTPAPIANVASTTGQDAWLVTYGLKSPQIVATKVKSVEKFMDKYNYYIFGMNAPDNTTGCPYVNMYGQVIGLLQMSQTSFDTHACDAAFARSLSANGFSLNDANYQQIGIPQAMPTDENQARLMLVMAAQAKDSLKYVAATNDFLELFPAATDGYNNRALIEAGAQQWANADETMKNCIRKANDKDEAHYNYAKMMYNYAVSGLHWSLDEALAEANEAYKAKPLPIYQHLQAQIIYAKGDYQQALNIFEQLSKDKNFNTPELLYEQAQCKHSLPHTCTGLRRDGQIPRCRLRLFALRISRAGPCQCPLLLRPRTGRSQGKALSASYLRPRTRHHPRPSGAHLLRRNGQSPAASQQARRCPQDSPALHRDSPRLSRWLHAPRTRPDTDQEEVRRPCQPAESQRPRQPTGSGTHRQIQQIIHMLSERESKKGEG